MSLLAFPCGNLRLVWRVCQREVCAAGLEARERGSRIRPASGLECRLADRPERGRLTLAPRGICRRRSVSQAAYLREIRLSLSIAPLLVLYWSSIVPLLMAVFCSPRPQRPGRRRCPGTSPTGSPTRSPAATPQTLRAVTYPALRSVGPEVEGAIDLVAFGKGQEEIGNLL